MDSGLADDEEDDQVIPTTMSASLGATPIASASVEEVAEEIEPEIAIADRLEDAMDEAMDQGEEQLKKLFGDTPAQAFYVKCDAETNPPEVRELGQVVTEIGVAVVKPAEFVVFRVSQWAGPGG